MPDKTYKIIFSWTFEPSIHVAVHGSDIIIKKKCDDILKSGNDNQIFCKQCLSTNIYKES